MIYEGWENINETQHYRNVAGVRTSYVKHLTYY